MTLEILLALVSAVIGILGLYHAKRDDTARLSTPGRWCFALLVMAAAFQVILSIRQNAMTRELVDSRASIYQELQASEARLREFRAILSDASQDSARLANQVRQIGDGMEAISHGVAGGGVLPQRERANMQTYWVDDVIVTPLSVSWIASDWIHPVSITAWFDGKPFRHGGKVRVELVNVRPSDLAGLTMVVRRYSIWWGPQTRSQAFVHGDIIDVTGDTGGFAVAAISGMKDTANLVNTRNPEAGIRLTIVR